MTNEEIIGKALEHAEVLGLKVELLHSPTVREAAVICFQTPKQGARVEIKIDPQNGEYLGAMWNDAEMKRSQ